MNEGLDEMSMMDFLTFGLAPLQIAFLAGLLGCNWEGMRWANNRGIYSGSWLVGGMAMSAWVWTWFIVSGAIRLTAWVVS